MEVWKSEGKSQIEEVKPWLQAQLFESWDLTSSI
jgi:hypothetical protein